MEESRRYIYIHTHGVDTPERCATPFYLATAAALMEHESTIVFTIKSSSLLKKGVAEDLYIKDGGAVLRYFMDQAREAGVKFLVCAPSLDLCGLQPEDLVDDVDEIIGGAALNELVQDAIVLCF